MPVSTEKDFQSKIEKLENWLASKDCLLYTSDAADE